MNHGKDKQVFLLCAGGICRPLSRANDLLLPSCSEIGNELTPDLELYLVYNLPMLVRVVR
jgi:hypothetical protein